MPSVGGAELFRLINASNISRVLPETENHLNKYKELDKEKCLGDIW